MKYRTILFDFDGTLADTAPLAIAAANALAREFGFAPIREEEIPALRAMSARELLTRRVGIPLWRMFKLRRFERRAREEMEHRSGEVNLFAGVPELLRELRAKGYELGIVTSNSEEAVLGALKRAGAEVDFVHAGSRFFGKARAIRTVLREYGLSRRHTLYVGDELRDAEACKKSNIDFLGVGWGFNSAEVLQNAGAPTVSTPRELLRLLSKI